MLEHHPADELIVTDSDYTDRQLLQIVESAHRAGVKVRVAPKTTELLVQRAEYVPGQGAPLFELRPPALAGTDWVVKRGFDLVVSSLLIVVGLPLWLAVAAAIKVTSHGPVFFRDHRIGLAPLESVRGSCDDLGEEAFLPQQQLMQPRLRPVRRDYEDPGSIAHGQHRSIH